MVTDTVLFKDNNNNNNNSTSNSSSSSNNDDNKTTTTSSSGISSEKEFYEIVGCAESGSEHPLAKAITNHAKNVFHLHTLQTPQHFEVK